MLDAALAHPTIFVRDLDRARVFYENLGLTVSAEVSTGIFMTAGAGTIFPLLLRSNATPQPTPWPLFRSMTFRALSRR